MKDLISRQAAVDRAVSIPMFGRDVKMVAVSEIKNLPSAQPKERTEERTETHACDLISRQVAIDALVGITMFKTKHEIMQRVNASVQDEQGWLGAVAECLDEIEDLPSAQPEIIRCEDCKWRMNQNGTMAWIPCRALVTPDDFYCKYAERKEQ